MATGAGNTKENKADPLIAQWVAQRREALAKAATAQRSLCPALYWVH